MKERPLSQSKGRTQRKIPPFRYDVVGRFLRPEKLKTARMDFSQKRISAEGLGNIEDEAIEHLVRKQKASGCRSLLPDDCTWGMFCDDRFRGGG